MGTSAATAFASPRSAGSAAGGWWVYRGGSFLSTPVSLLLAGSAGESAFHLSGPVPASIPGDSWRPARLASIASLRGDLGGDWWGNWVDALRSHLWPRHHGAKFIAAAVVLQLNLRPGLPRSVNATAQPPVGQQVGCVFARYRVVALGFAVLNHAATTFACPTHAPSRPRVSTIRWACCTSCG